MKSTTTSTFDCLVLSGGGAKAAYAAGVAKALFEYYSLESTSPNLCFIGTSAGALNACVLAGAGPDDLIRLWLSANNKEVLDVRIRNVKFRRFMTLFGHTSPFSIYPNSGLARLIIDNVDFKRLKNRNIIIPATDYTRGELKAFYVSDLVDQFISYDASLPIEDRRLAHCIRIQDNEMLKLALLASSAIPYFFPPVKIENSWYVDGGVGNNTPTREAAYFLRFLEELQLGVAGEVYCIKQDPPRVILEGRREFESAEILKRTLDIYHYVHTEPIVKAWFRINDEARRLSEKVRRFTEWLPSLDLPSDKTGQISEQVSENVARLGGATKRREIPLIVIEPSLPLGDSLDFDPTKARQNIEVGYIDMLNTLRHTGKITDIQHSDLSNRTLFSGG